MTKDKPFIGPFSLGQAEDILAKAYCPHCGHELGVKNEQLEKKMCAHQFLASEVIMKNRKLAEQNLEFQTAGEMIGYIKVKRVIAKDGTCEITTTDDRRPGFILDLKVDE